MRIVLAGGVGAMPFAGVAWQVLQYLEGFRRLGHDVFYLEDTQRWPYDPVQDTVCDDAGPAIAYVARLMERVGLQRAWAYRDVAQGALHGVTEEALVRTLCDADALINLSGVMVLREEHLCVPTRIYLETDPVLPQIEVAQGRDFTIEFLGAHTHHFSYGENFGSADCGVPVERFHYHPTRPPVILDWWDGGGSPTLDGRAFTTVANWRQTSKDIDAYRTFIVGSAGEFSVAKEQNVALRSGWFSDRTASYLAAGRPAIVQDTGFGCALPTGEGLLAFSTIEEAQAAFAAVQSDYPHHCRAARAIASEYLRAETVLGELLTCAC